MPVTAPARIGPYRVERLLGTGSFATVWLGHDPALDCPVAIKVLAENWSHDLRVRERFLDEARLLRRLAHERLVPVHAVGELPDGRPYAVLAWADGGSLRDRLARGPLPVSDAVALLDQIAAGVAVLHRHGVVHRDLTPGNILFRSRPRAGSGSGSGAGGEQVLVADLGLAKALAVSSGLTAPAGTPGYMAPEQDDPRAVVDTRADVFGLGRLALRLLGDAPADPVGPPPAGPPSAGPPPGHPGASPAPPPRLRDGVPAEVAAVLHRATALRPADRYPDAAAFRAALARAVAAASGGAHPDRPRPRVDRSPAPPQRTGRRFVTAGAGLLAFAALATTSGDAGPGRPGQPHAMTAVSGPITVTLPAGWRATGTGWAGQYGDDGDLEPALVISPDPGRWATDPRVPGAFVGLSPSLARRTTPQGYLAERPHADCVAAPVRRTRQGAADWVVAAFTCPSGRPLIVEAAGLAPGRAGLLYAQVVPPEGGGDGFVDALLGGVRLG
ncbi:serine/threonine-protein kinase [Micromonospora sp. URMC 103]|uniref:serine/threonine-protein kinase n=1 Tax=Micromonospora sp. URMC 103 TaxID=3423406 RepID=UPI003F1DCAC5